MAKSQKTELRYCIDYINPRHPFLDNGNLNVRHYRVPEHVGVEEAESVLTVILSFGAKIVALYRGNVLAGKLAEWPTPMIVDSEDWVSTEWLKSLYKNRRKAHVFGKNDGKSLYCFEVEDDPYNVGHEIEIKIID